MSSYWGVTPHTYFLFLSFSPSLKRPHASLPRQHLDSLRQELDAQKFDVKNNLHILSANQSHLFPKLCVLNLGSAEFTKLEPVFDILHFGTCLELADSNASARGNKQASFGFTGQNRRNRCSSTHISEPGMFLHTRTDLAVETFEALSTLLVEALKLSPEAPPIFSPVPGIDSFRRLKFAGCISKNNILEYLAPTLNDKNNPLVVAHTDDGNDPAPEKCFAIMASRLLVDATRGKPELKRVLQIGAQRKSCSDFIKSAYSTGTYIDSLAFYFKSLPIQDSGFYPDSYFQDTIGQTCVLSRGNILVSPCNGDRCVFESVFCSAIDLYISHGDPAGVPQMLEVALACLYIPDPRKYTFMVQE